MANISKMSTGKISLRLLEIEKDLDNHKLAMAKLKLEKKILLQEQRRHISQNGKKPAPPKQMGKHATPLEAILDKVSKDVLNKK